MRIPLSVVYYTMLTISTDFYELDYLPAPRLSTDYFEADSERPSTPSLASTPTTPLSPTMPSTPYTSTISRPRRRLPLSKIEDPLLACARDNQAKAPASPYLSRFGVSSPLVCSAAENHLLAVKEWTPPPVIDTMMREPVEEQEQGIFSYFDEDSVPEQETDYTRANLVAHAKVYAIAEQ